MHHRVLLLGSTGSIGLAALDVARTLRGEVTVVGAAAGTRWEELAAQAREHAIPAVAIADERAAARLRDAVPSSTRVYSGTNGLIDFVGQSDCDFVLAAIVGAAGLPATLAAVDRGIDVGLANKESLVIAGDVLVPLAAKRGGALIPVDSEHSAIFQALKCGTPAEVRRLLLTASGGPFRTWPADRIRRATLDEALKHPTWAMGPKITIDSATMMNKALEVIEAAYLFGVSPERIEVVVHPQAIVHSMVEYCDGSTIAQLGPPDMRTPIQYAITYPERRAARTPALDWTALRRLEFETPDFERFPALRLGFQAASAGGLCGAVLNAANEAAVDCFRAGRILFGQISELVAATLAAHRPVERPDLDQMRACDAWARQEVLAWASR